MLKLDRVSKTYFRRGQPVTALDNVTLHVEMGEFVTVLGGRASGKSTLLGVAAGLVRPDSGHIAIDGERLDEMSDRHLTTLRRSTVSLVQTSLPSPTSAPVVELVALPLRMQSGDARSSLVEAERVLEALGAQSCADAGIEELSDGERRLVAIAQALVTKPRLLLLDQPASDLELAEETELLGVLSTLASSSNVAVVMTARSATEAGAASRVASISSGRLLEGRQTDDEPDQADVLPLDLRRRGAGGVHDQGGNDA